jgi:hypothetical protein
MSSDSNFPLLKEEKILWAGRPGQGVIFTSQDFFLIPFSLLWCGFAIFWEFSVATTNNAPIIMKIWGVPFVLMGLYFVAGRFVADSFIRNSLRYAVTNKRVLIQRYWPTPKFTAISLRQTGDVELALRSDGSGTIRFGSQPSFWTRGTGFGAMTPSLDPTPQLLAINDARRVYQLVQETQGVET